MAWGALRFFVNTVCGRDHLEATVAVDKHFPRTRSLRAVAFTFALRVVAVATIVATVGLLLVCAYLLGRETTWLPVPPYAVNRFL